MLANMCPLDKYILFSIILSYWKVNNIFFLNSIFSILCLAWTVLYQKFCISKQELDLLEFLWVFFFRI